MKLFTIYTITVFAALCLGAKVSVKAGDKPAGDTCFAPMECVEPLYCLKASLERHACEKKPCRGQNECRIGQYCGKDGFCTVPDCGGDGDCKGDTVCQVNKRCGSKSSGGQACNRGPQCWSGKCKDEKCTPNNPPPKPAPSSAPAPTPTPVADDTGLDEDDEDQGIIGDTVDAVDGLEDNVGKAFRLGGGGIAGIVIGSLLLLALCCGLVFCLRFLKRKRNEES